MKKKVMLTLFVLNVFAVSAQDQIIIGKDTLVNQSNATRDHSVLKKIAIPTVLVGYGLVGLTSGEIRDINRQVQRKVGDHDNSTKIDDYTRYAPALSVYALNAMGIKGKHNFRDRTVILLTSQLIMCGTVMSVKSLAKIERPDGTTDNSFPSGHTATAFSGAEFMWQEYKDVSVWYGISGYVVAAGTGFLRIYNNRHWVTDVAAGAGIGILSTKLAYWLYPSMQKLFFGTEENKMSAIALPFYNGQQVGLNLALKF
ncbi:phosphatase PAP2 family protein [Flavobacterium subsaxonicum]|uniref:PA-phosphatase n=1 Tax=Flavobacterium subsaxonicum WB 4.1-42 = DSM 21790 TaxID=1121898 RepID=A0A0A2MH12_9FLAO|nr:phosphatase PAP2 family protein [Flavobacterium subsaxonicum]KGO91962.1 PA-phosphatase [Flavobacterium subsaxonicum WB 4.1-42 = DSM 21790]